MKCRYCGEEIKAIRTYDGPSKIVDPGIIPFWADLKGRGLVVTDEGDVVRCRLDGSPEEITGVGHQIHAAVCYARRAKRG